MQFVFYTISIEVILLVAYVLGNPVIDPISSQRTGKTNGIKFYAYTRTTADKPTLVQAQVESVIRSGINTLNPLTLAIPHRLSKYNAEECQIITKTKLQVADGNVIVADYSLFAGNTTMNEALVASAVGKAVGDLLIFLGQEFDMKLDDMHLVGFSLGAQIAGIAGHHVEQKMGRKLKRITALDPIGPLFEEVSTSGDMRLSADDAEFVEVIHTNAGHLGAETPCGHADYYPNGGSWQFGCKMGDNLCSHKRSYQLIPDMWRILKDQEFVVSKCSSLNSMSGNSCRWVNHLMGDLNSTNHQTSSPTTTTTSAIYYLETNGRAPYGKGAYQMQFW